MRPAPISRRCLVAGAGAALAAVALPTGVVEAVAAEMPPTGSAAGLSAVFDPAAFVADLAAAGYDIQVARSTRLEDRGRAYFMITPKCGRGFDRSYGEVMERWADRLAGAPDHVERVVAHLEERVSSACSSRC